MCFYVSKLIVLPLLKTVSLCQCLQVISLTLGHGHTGCLLGIEYCWKRTHLEALVSLYILYTWIKQQDCQSLPTETTLKAFSNLFHSSCCSKKPFLGLSAVSALTTIIHARVPAPVWSLLPGMSYSKNQDTYPGSMDMLPWHFLSCHSPYPKHEFVVSPAISEVGEYVGITLQTKEGVVLLW